MSMAAKTASAIQRKREQIAELVVERQYAMHDDYWESFGEEGWKKSVRDVDYHLTYLVEAMAVQETVLFTEYVAWVKVLFAGLNFPEETVRTTLHLTRDVLHEQLPAAHHDMVDHYILAGLERLSEAPATIPSMLEEGAPLHDLARRYLDALLRAERHAASQMILEAVEEGTSVREVYKYVFQPVQREVGRLWQMNRLSVAQEHYCTAATQMIMSQLYPAIFAGEKTGHRMVATCVEGDLHELGVRMVADFFEMEGWDTYYLGANTPVASIVQTLEERDVDLLAVSATIPAHTGKVQELIERVRDAEAGAGLKILVGGYPFNSSPELWRRVGADGYARDADEAIATGARLVKEA